MRIRTVLAVVILLLSLSLAEAEIYQWVDEKGVVTFKDTPPPPSRKIRKVKVYNAGDFVPPPRPQPAPAKPGGKSVAVPAPHPAPPGKERFTGTVEIFVTDWCGYCKQAQNYLKRKGIPYVVYDIEKDSAANRRHKELGGRGVPLIVIGSNKISGFSPETMEYYLNSR